MIECSFLWVNCFFNRTLHKGISVILATFECEWRNVSSQIRPLYTSFEVLSCWNNCSIIITALKAYRGTGEYFYICMRRSSIQLHLLVWSLLNLQNCRLLWNQTEVSQGMLQHTELVWMNVVKVFYIHIFLSIYFNKKYECTSGRLTFFSTTFCLGLIISLSLTKAKNWRLTDKRGFLLVNR